jgi:multiple sugar transport system ATP-binding protein
MNFIPGKVVNGMAVADENRHALPPLEVDDLPDGTTIEFGLRPEHLQISDGDSGLSAVVRQVDQTGSQTHVIAEVFGREITVVLDGMVILAPEDNIKLTAKSEDIYLFAAGDGKAVGPRPKPRIRERNL